jgi:L-ascorbate metabolism protein UlaG (beta-lactamase superfamily)
MGRYRALLAGAAVALTLCSSATWAAVDPAMLKARQKFFGIENVDGNTGAVKKDKVIFSWATNTTYVTSIMGRIVLLDSFIQRPELPTAPIDRRMSPVLPQDFIDVRPEAIFLGHGHGDHADNAAYVAKWTNAVVYASPETCDVLQTDVQRLAADPNAVNGGVPLIPNNAPLNCVGVVPRGSMPGEFDVNTGQSKFERIATPLDSMVCVLAFKHVHSGTAPVDSSFTHATLSDLADPRYAGRTVTTPAPAVTYPAMFPAVTSFTPPANLANAVPGQINTTTNGFGGAAGPIEIYYQFILRSGYNFSFAWLNSAGPAKEGIGIDPGFVSLAQFTNPATPAATLALASSIGAGLYSLMDRLPSPDLLLGSIVSLGAANNQERDIITVIQHLKPKVYIPGHLTTVAQPGSAIYHMISYRETALNMGIPQSQMPEFRLLVDPNDFFVPQVYTPTDPRWQDANKSARFAQDCS